MNQLIQGINVTDTWIKAMQYLNENGKEAYNLIAEIEHANIDDESIRRQVNAVLKSQNDQTVDTVANTIFPYVLQGRDQDRDQDRDYFYHRFHQVYSTLRKISENQRGTYFGRLVAWDFENYGENSFNQLEYTIVKLIRERTNGRHIRVMYEMSIYDPRFDNNTTMGFPCMSFISVKVRDDFVDLTAIYRNQYFVQKAYGNYLGLGRLLEYIATHSGYRMGKLTCIATHAALGRIQKANLDKLLELASPMQQMDFGI